MRTYKTRLGYETVNSYQEAFRGSVALISYRNITDRASGLFHYCNKAQHTFSPSLTNVSINTFDTDFRSGIFESIITKRENFNVEHFGIQSSDFFMTSRRKWSKLQLCSIVSLTILIILIVGGIIWATEYHILKT